MKIKLNKTITVMGKEDKVSGKGNKYIILNGFDEEGRVHSLYCPEVDLVSDLKSMDRIDAVLEVTYKEKYDKIELLSYRKLNLNVNL